MPRSSTAAKPQCDVFLTIVFQSHLGQPNVETAIGSRLAGLDEPMEDPAAVDAASLKRSRRVISRSYGIRSPHTGCVERARRRLSAGAVRASGSRLRPRTASCADTQAVHY